MIMLPIGRLAAAGMLLTGIGVEHAMPELHSASTPGRTPTVTTPHVATPQVSTGAITTPSQTVHAGVDPIHLPTSVRGDLGGLVSKEIDTPAATPALDAAPAVPSLTVASIDVAPVDVDEVPVTVDLPATATVGDDGAHASAAGLPTTLDVVQNGDGAAIRGAGVTVSVGLDG